MEGTLCVPSISRYHGFLRRTPLRAPEAERTTAHFFPKEDYL